MYKYFSKITEKEIQNIILILENRGCITEGDSVYIYSTQYKEAVSELNNILIDYGYYGEVEAIGNCKNGIAIYGVYDPQKITFYDAMKYIEKEGCNQGWE